MKFLQVTGEDINFNKNTYVYDLKTTKTKLEIEAIADDKDAVVEIVGNENLKDKSIIKIKVTAPDKTELEYTINIIMNKQINYLLFVGIGIIVISLILNVVFIVKIKKNKENSI